MPIDKKDNKNRLRKLAMLRNKKRGGGRGGDDSDDSSVDSNGNLKGFIAYSEEDSSYHPTSSSNSTPVAKRTRNKGLKSSKGKYSKKHESEESEEESEESESEEEVVRKRSKKVAKKSKSTTKSKSRRRYETESEEEETEDESEEEEESDEESEDSEDYDEDEEDMEEEDEEEEENGGFILRLGGMDDDRMVPKRHNMKKQPKIVKQFVKLVTQPVDDNSIDAQIDIFKALPEDQQKKLVDVLESRSNNAALANPQQNLMFKILTMKLPTETQSMVLGKYNSLQTMDPGSGEYYKLRNWLEKLTSLPFGIYKELPVKLIDGNESCGAFMERARKCLDEAIYGQDEAKLQVLQFIGTKIANPDSRGFSLLLAGPPGIGKTSLIKNGIAKALNWPFQFISLGGDSDASTYTGHQLVYESSHCGKIVNSLATAKSMSMVLMFDELDKISSTPKGEEVQHLLVHLTDPVQNEEFEDKYLSGIPIDLSKVMFTFSANDLSRIDRVLMDRFVVINLEGYSQKEKCAIAENYLWPSALKEVHLGEKVGLNNDLLKHIIEHYAKEEKGVRELKRCLEQIAQKINMLRMFNTKDLPFHIKDFKLPFEMKKEHIDLFLKKKESRDQPPLGMYI